MALPKQEYRCMICSHSVYFEPTYFAIYYCVMLDRTAISQHDSQNMLGSIEVIDKQCEEAWNAVAHITFPTDYQQADRIAVFGMGGSALGADIIKTLFRSELRIPIEIVSDYSIPAWVNENTLAIVSSYSGTTEETVEVAQNILSHTKKVIVVTTGGALKEFAEREQLPAYIFSPSYNPSQQPRMAVGYSIMGMMGAFSALGLIAVTDEQVKGVLETIRGFQAKFGADVAEEQNLAKQLAAAMKGKLPVLISSEFLEGVTHVFANQMNENAKQFVARFPIPEMNHHLIEGFVHPTDALHQFVFVFLKSALYHPRNQIRHRVTEEIVRKQGMSSFAVELTGATPMEQLFEVLVLGSYTSLYLAILNDLDPSPIPNVNFLKEELKKA